MKTKNIFSFSDVSHNAGLAILVLVCLQHLYFCLQPKDNKAHLLAGPERRLRISAQRQIIQVGLIQLYTLQKGASIVSIVWPQLEKPNTQSKRKSFGPKLDPNRTKNTTLKRSQCRPYTQPVYLSQISLRRSMTLFHLVYILQHLVRCRSVRVYHL